MKKEELIERLKSGEVRDYHYHYVASGRVFSDIYKVEPLYNREGDLITTQRQSIYKSHLSFIKFATKCSLFDGIAVRHGVVSAIRKEVDYNDEDDEIEHVFFEEITDEFLAKLEESSQNALDKLVKERDDSKLIFIYADCVYALFSDATKEQIHELLSALKESESECIVLKNETGMNV